MALALALVSMHLLSKNMSWPTESFLGWAVSQRGARVVRHATNLAGMSNLTALSCSARLSVQGHHHRPTDIGHIQFARAGFPVAANHLTLLYAVSTRSTWDWAMYSDTPIRSPFHGYGRHCKKKKKKNPAVRYDGCDGIDPTDAGQRAQCRIPGTWATHFQRSSAPDNDRDTRCHLEFVFCLFCKTCLRRLSDFASSSLSPTMSAVNVTVPFWKMP
ncbi:hypothetical protein MAPG_04505 [Magnaporthiopsis poae ATCC 64411]|uniref:Secreted protein n=1 Tax=Magnaporthiopsis poae (strain ATCC 64411 / 73-15) TaxID=644358 RepID=A0A0C4DWX1_MAGP6|nr:hypothetical protein MAPG_04505 [Magnaporthiopsis poae ATCC 64411]